MRYLTWILFVAVMLGLAGCDEDLKTIAGPSPNLQPTFSSIFQEIFQTTDSAGRTSCVTCHTSVGRVPPAGIDLSTSSAAYSSLVGVAARGKPGLLRVAPGDPENSYLIHKLEGRSDIVGRRMPFNPPYLTDGQISIIKRWIATDARNN